MKLEDQVCSLENAKKLDELGVKAESYFIHTDDGVNPRHFTPNWWEVTPAYTVAELLNMLQKWRDACMCELLLSEIDTDSLCELLIVLIEDGRLKAEDLG